ncbi:hypothetical protein [Aeoliella sp. SH292]|uniref:hypothetical protein n=1 Tax=Aeoliella sp. SH292 TaxID=3454464 RepID=UPI003F945931
MRKLHFLLVALAILHIPCGVGKAATLTVTSDLLIQLDGTNTTLVSGGVQEWNNQVSVAGSPASFTAPASGNRPALLTAETMPNGSQHNVLSFSKGGSGTSAPSISTGDHLAAGPSVAFNDLKTLTVFTVFKTNSLAPAGNSVGQKEQVVFGSNHFVPSTASSTIGWSHTIEDDFDSAATGDQPALMPQFRQSGALNEPFTDPDLAPASVSPATWYVVASRFNGSEVDVNGLSAFSTTSMVLTPGTSPNSLITAVKSRTAMGEHEWTDHVRFTIGKNPATSGGSSTRGFLDGQIAEILVYGDTLSEADFNAVSGYLAQKYLIPEPATNLLLLASCLLGAAFACRRGVRPS